jgi:hypothetical protein
MQMKIGMYELRPAVTFQITAVYRCVPGCLGLEYKFRPAVTFQILLCARLLRVWVLVASRVQFSAVTFVYRVCRTLLE